MSKPKFKSLFSHTLQLITLVKRFSIYMEHYPFLINLIFLTKAMVRNYRYLCVCVWERERHKNVMETIVYDLYSALKKTKLPGLLWKGSLQPVCNLLPINYGKITSQTCTGRHSFSHWCWHRPGYASHL